MTLTHRSVPVEQPPPRPVSATAGKSQNQVLGELLRRCAQHDEAGLARLYELTSPWIYALVTRLTSSASVADNAMVGIYAKVWRQAARHDGDQSVLAWITTIAGEEARTVQAHSQTPNAGLGGPAFPDSTANDGSAVVLGGQRQLSISCQRSCGHDSSAQLSDGGRMNERRGT